MSDALHAAGPQAAHIGALWWMTFWLCTAVFAAVIAALAWAVWRSRAAARKAGAPGNVAPPLAGGALADGDSPPRPADDATRRSAVDLGMSASFERRLRLGVGIVVAVS